MPTTMRVAIALGLFVWGTAGGAVAQAVDPALRGAYAPGGDCTKQPRVVLSDVLTIYDGVAPNRIAPLDSCRSCVGGAQYSGIEVWVAQLGANGEPIQPMFRFNADEKKGALVVDKYDMQTMPAPVRAVAMASPLKRCAK